MLHRIQTPCVFPIFTWLFLLLFKDFILFILKAISFHICLYSFIFFLKPEQTVEHTGTCLGVSPSEPASVSISSLFCSSKLQTTKHLVLYSLAPPTLRLGCKSPAESLQPGQRYWTRDCIQPSWSSCMLMFELWHTFLLRFLFLFSMKICCLSALLYSRIS